MQNTLISSNKQCPCIMFRICLYARRNILTWVTYMYIPILLANSRTKWKLLPQANQSGNIKAQYSDKEPLVKHFTLLNTEISRLYIYIYRKRER
jgi:hypothetical protein